MVSSQEQLSCAIKGIWDSLTLLHLLKEFTKLSRVRGTQWKTIGLVYGDGGNPHDEYPFIGDPRLDYVQGFAVLDGTLDADLQIQQLWQMAGRVLDRNKHTK